MNQPKADLAKTDMAKSTIEIVLEKPIVTTDIFTTVGTPTSQLPVKTPK